MKTILVDTVDCFVSRDGEMFVDMYTLLEKFPNRKIVVTNADAEQSKKFKLDALPYEVFTLSHKPEKTDPVYFKTLLKQYDLLPEEVVYFEHNSLAVESAYSVGITAYMYDEAKKDILSLAQFLDTNL